MKTLVRLGFGWKLLVRIDALVLHDAHAVEVLRIDHEGRVRRVDELVLRVARDLGLEVLEQILLCLAVKGQPGFVQE